MKQLRHYWDFALFALVVAVFLLIATQRLGAVPVYDIDESETLQVSYEMLHRGQLALPMYRYLGGNIEHVWHSLTPVYYVMQTGFLKVFGFGVLQGRAFNLTTAGLTLLMVYLIGRRIFDWRVGFIGVVIIVSDPTLLERSRLLRNDYAAEAFALLAFLLYEIAEQRKSSRLYIGAGLAAGAGVMCHTSILYMFGAICLLMLLRDGLRILASRKLYQFTLGALAVMAYEIIYDIIDYKNFLLQYRDDDLHFRVLQPWGWWYNLLEEPERYIRWYNAYGVTFSNVPRTLLHLFQLLTLIAVVYLTARCIRYFRRGNVMAEPRVGVLLVTAIAVLFFAVFMRKADFYNIHLATWFALCIGILLRDAVNLLPRLQSLRLPKAGFLHASEVIVVSVAVIGYGYLFANQQRRYLKEARNPYLASFEEFKSVLNDVVPDRVCPLAVKTPVMWLAFPEEDRCFASLEKRMLEAVDIRDKGYALLVRPRSPDFWARGLYQQHHLIAEVHDSPYGTFMVYYTGEDPSYPSLTPKEYYLFGRWRGHVIDSQIAAAREVWSASATDPGGDINSTDRTIGSELLARSVSQNTVRSGTIDLKPTTAYQIIVDVTSPDAQWEMAIVDEGTGRGIKEIEIPPRQSQQHIVELFRTFEGNHIKLTILPHNREPADAFHISRVSIREIAQV
jgi:4-amino-4-deoxy-L-arabinose transferase-like glycosyltransferase